MNRKFAVIATILIFALISAAFLRPADENPDFGGADKVFSSADKLLITDCAGDTDRLCAEYIPLCRTNFAPTAFVSIHFSNNLGSVAFTANCYADGALVDSGGVPQGDEFGFVERLEGENWVRHCELSFYDISRDAASHFSLHSDGSRVPYKVLDECDEIGIEIPHFAPGTYRITYYFRESIDSDPQRYTTGEELFSITHTFSLPERTDKPFDVLSVQVSDRAYDQFGRFEVMPQIRTDGKPLYLDSGALRLEVATGFGWKDVETSRYAAVPVRPDRDYGEERYVRPKGGTDCNIVAFRLWVYADDPTADYRLTLHFVENPDGSGERYTLALRLKFE